MLQLSPSARIFPAGPDRIYWMTESKQGCWSFPGAGTLATLLSTAQTVDDILARFADDERGQAARVLDELIERGLVESVSCPPYIAQLCRESGISPHKMQRNRWEKGATIRYAAAAAEREALEQALAAAGLPISADGQLQILAVADYLEPGVEAMHGEFQRRGVPWALCKMTGAEVWIGPFFVPGRTACWRCLELRLRERAWLSSQIAPENAPLWTPYESENRLRAAAEFATQETARWLMEAPHSLEGAVWCFSWATLQAGRHTVGRLPHCADCGTARPEARIGHFELKSARVRWDPPADLRSAGPQAVIDRLEPLSSPITGILRRFERRDLGSSPLVFTYGGVYNAALPPGPLRIPGGIVQPGVCSGRGWSVAEARAACLAEAVERYSLQFRGDEPRQTARVDELGDAAVHPDTVLLFSQRQFANRQEWNRQHALEESVPEPFDETEPIEWMAGWSLTEGRRRYLPMALAAQYYRPAGKRWIGDADSTGGAAGSCREEAVLSAILELVERDARALWWYNQAARPAWEVETVSDPLCREVCRQLEVQGWKIRIADITTDIPIPVLAAVATRNNAWMRGTAAHLNRATALRHALGELWQLSKAPARSGPAPPTLAGEREMPPMQPPEGGEVDLEKLIRECCAKIRQAGHDVIVFDMTRPEIGFPVVRVVAPGLRPAKPRFAPGRLFDVPRRLGWLSHVKAEAEMPAHTA